MWLEPTILLVPIANMDGDLLFMTKLSDAVGHCMYNFNTNQYYYGWQFCQQQYIRHIYMWLELTIMSVTITDMEADLLFPTKLLDAFSTQFYHCDAHVLPQVILHTLGFPIISWLEMHKDCCRTGLFFWIVESPFFGWYPPHILTLQQLIPKLFWDIY